MRSSLLGLTVVLSAWTLLPASSVQAQTSGFSDPFFLYYGFYLPRQAALAATPTTPSMLNDVSSARQSYALADRAGLYDPIQSPFSDPGDPLSSYSARNNGREALPRLAGQFVSPRATNGIPPTPFYNKTARYYPSLRSGSGANRNISQSRSTVGSSAGSPSATGGIRGY